MYPTKTIKEKIKLLAIILYPILITQVGLYSMNFVDTIMSGRAGANDLAGVAIGSSLWVPVFTGLSGILLAITPIVSHYIGAKQEDRVSFSVLQGIYLSIALSVSILVVGYFILDPILNTMDLNNKVAQIAKDYLIGLSFGIIPLFIYSVLRSFFDALGETRTTMLVTLTSLPINVFFNYVLIFGKWGFPQLGGVGAGYASAITYWFILLIALLV
ncbi:MATE family efflux transporter, partial [Guptibacillus hwajinpoensis]